MLTTTQAATALGITERRVRQLIREGKLTAQRHGRDWVIDPRALARATQRPTVGYPKGRPRGRRLIEFLPDVVC